MKVYVNKETYAICYACDRAPMIEKAANDKINSPEALDRLLAKFSRSFIFNMDDHRRAIVRDIFERRCWAQAEQEFNDIWVESELP